jgi:hypothetical protein
LCHQLIVPPSCPLETAFQIADFHLILAHQFSSGLIDLSERRRLLGGIHAWLRLLSRTPTSQPKETYQPRKSTQTEGQTKEFMMITEVIVMGWLQQAEAGGMIIIICIF